MNGSSSRNRRGSSPLAWSKSVGADVGGEFAVAVQQGGLLVFVQFAHEVYEAAGDIFPHAVHKVDSFAGDLNHDFPAVFAGMEALNVAEFFQPVHQPSGRCRAVTHFFGNIGHREVIFIGQITKEKKLCERHIPFVQLFGEIEQEGTLSEHDEVSQSSGILADELVVVNGLHGWLGFEG